MDPKHDWSIEMEESTEDDTRVEQEASQGKGGLFERKHILRDGKV